MKPSEMRPGDVALHVRGEATDVVMRGPDTESGGVWHSFAPHDRTFHPSVAGDEPDRLWTDVELLVSARERDEAVVRADNLENELDDERYRHKITIAQHGQAVASLDGAEELIRTRTDERDAAEKRAAKMCRERDGWRECVEAIGRERDEAVKRAELVEADRDWWRGKWDRAAEGWDEAEQEVTRCRLENDGLRDQVQALLPHSKPAVTYDELWRVLAAHDPGDDELAVSRVRRVTDAVWALLHPTPDPVATRRDEWAQALHGGCFKELPPGMQECVLAAIKQADQEKGNKE